jgi:DNA-binding transcriptional ArsR family regulator
LPRCIGAGKETLAQKRNCHLVVTNNVDMSRHMKSENALNALSALAQPTRLDVFRLLVKQEPHGLPAGEIARRMDVPHNTMSTHLAILSRAGLISGERHSRSLIYRIELQAVRQLVLFLLRDCCNGRPELCAPLIEDLSTCCSQPGVSCD